jgi:hypothetical protein
MRSGLPLTPTLSPAGRGRRATRRAQRGGWGECEATRFDSPPTLGEGEHLATRILPSHAWWTSFISQEKGIIFHLSPPGRGRRA